MKRDTTKLTSGSKVAVIGGGPAGSLFALFLLHYARERGIRLDVTIYQERDFNDLGPKGCKGCAGILSASLLRNLDELGLVMPEEIIQSRIEQYVVHSPHTSISISNREKGTQIFSIYRGGGPRVSHYEARISFDGWLLAQAQQHGAVVKNEFVSRISLQNEALIEASGRELAYDLAVLASGANARHIPIQGSNYVPSRTRTMTQDELHAGTTAVRSRLQNAAHVFLIPQSGLIFGTLVPKGPFINVSLLSTGEKPIPIADFLHQDLVRGVLPEQYERACGCQPQAVVGSAHNYFADRFVAIGDAAVSRLYKDGIGSSLLTAREVARTVVYHGLSRRDFERYYQPLCSDLQRDNWWGRLIFAANDKVKDSRPFLLAQHRLVSNEQNNIRAPQPFTKSAWGMFTGSYSYRSIARMMLNPVSLTKLSLALLGEGLRAPFRRGVSVHRRLHVGRRKILILGGGFGGVYALRYLVRSLNRNENVETTMVNDENFFLFSPLLHEVAAGRIETRHIAYPVRRLHWRDRFDFVQGEVKRIDLDGGQVVTTAGTLEYDYLVLALGSVTDMSALADAGGLVFTLKTLHDSMLIRNHLISLLEQASKEKDAERRRHILTMVVSGNSYICVQVVAELRDFIFKSLARFYRNVPTENIRIILVSTESRIMAQLHPKISAYGTDYLQRLGIEIRLESRVTSVSKGSVEINKVEVIPASTLIYVAGTIASPRIAELPVEKDDIGRVLVNQFLEVSGRPGVYAVGDCAHYEDPRSSRPIPPRAHTTVRQAKIAANNILAEIRGRDKKPYRYSDTVQFVSLGPQKAVFRFKGGLRLYGFPARLVWLVAYTLLVTGTYNRIRILLDWLLSLVFGQDITFLRLKEFRENPPEQPGQR